MDDRHLPMTKAHMAYGLWPGELIKANGVIADSWGPLVCTCRDYCSSDLDMFFN